ncbi:DUF2254 domain-containing protein [Serinibacter salmoneus]|uniref:Putative membrane protein n=1 Tax=Serinibacter salmoneus TaxID=556530 RepID=A0A2A9CWX7_9MICO|nr:DUF2254 domain-containing protein [Serinibacter salmoneus]PFG18505.1 putative membrane protein [Serinibacter salmoneus]
MATLLIYARRITRRIWFRAAAFAAAGVLLALLAPLASAWAPLGAIDLGQEALSPILQILASSMLAVTTFSVATMVSSLASAAATTTPRATELLAQDRSSQTALSTFIGAFAFAIVGIVALATQYYDPAARIVLFLGALAVIVVVIATLLRWISHLVTFGHHADVLDRVEQRTTAVLTAFARSPRFGGAPVIGAPPGAHTITAGRSGFVTHVDVPSLQRWAQRGDYRVHLEVLPGDLVDAGSPILRVEALGDASQEVSWQEMARAAVSVERHRTHEQDPRLGLVTLSEISSRALSPGVNDPGGAIETLATLHRVLRAYLTTEVDPTITADRVHVPSLDLATLLRDAVEPTARDGAGTVEVAIRVQRTLGLLLPHADPTQARALRAASSDAEARALDALTHESDRARVRESAAALRSATTPR